MKCSAFRATALIWSINMKSLTKIALPFLTFLAVNAQAEVVNFNRIINITVDPACRLTSPSFITQSISVHTPKLTHQGSVSVLCPLDTAYTLQTNAPNNGYVPALGGVHPSIPMYVYKGNIGGAMSPFGSVMNSQHVGTTSTGLIETYPFWLATNSHDGGNTADAVPYSGIGYQSTIIWTLTF